MIMNFKRFITFLFCALVCFATVAQAREKSVVIGVSASKPSSATETYIKAIRRAGGTPIIIPITTNEAELKAVLKRIDGVVMTGGEDVEPWRYGEQPTPELGGVYPERDEFDIKLIQLAAAKRLPIMGICRGAQVMNVAFGGTLYQDIPSQLPQSKVDHYFGTKRAHKIEIKQESNLHKILGDEAIVNSVHHQSVKKLAPGFIVTAVAEDGVVEGIEMESGKPIFGIQFHPEVFVAAGDDDFLGLFEYLVKAAKR